MVADNREGSRLPSLSPDRADRLASLAKGVSGAVPILGSALAEVIGAVIPQQRVDRIVEVLERLDDRLSSVESDLIRDRLHQSAEARDLLEDGIVQASRGVSEERRDRIAAMLQSTLTREDLEYVRKKRLWAILGELTDVELLILQHHGIRFHDDNGDFWEKHKDAITGPHVHLGSSEEEVDQGAVQKSFDKHLVELGLIEPNFKKPRRDELPDFDPKTGMMKASGHQITRLGGLLLRYLDLPSYL